MTRVFKVVWNAQKPIGTPLEADGHCVLCNHEISNIENHYAREAEDIRICLMCVNTLSESYESTFNHDAPKRDAIRGENQ